MKYFITISLLALTISCTNDDEQKIECESKYDTSNWQFEMFKTDYIIKFPDNYIGTGMVGFEGNLFSKIKQDSSISIFYNYCGSLYCDDFGDTLESEIPDTIIYERNIGDNLLLTNWMFICNDDDNEFSILYTDDLDPVNGVLFMKVDGIYLESATIIYSLESFEELKSIIGTISIATTIH